MEQVAGTALLAFGGYVAAQSSQRCRAGSRVTRLLCLGMLVLLMPTGIASCIIGVGWLLSLARRLRSIGWGVFATGCALYGRGLLSALSPSRGILISAALWAIGWATLVRHSRRALFGRHGLRWEIYRARRASAPRSDGELWRARAVDALARASDTLKMLPLERRISVQPRSVTDRQTLCVGDAVRAGVAALADGDPTAAREQFASAEKAASTLAGTRIDRREELGLWLELIGWCELAATLIDEEDLN